MIVVGARVLASPRMPRKVTRREFIETAAGAAALAASDRIASAAAPRRPNILFILADDLGYGDLSYSYNWPFSFQKGFLYEGGIRVPAIVRWTGTVPPGRVTDQAAITMDWTATILEATGTAPDPSYALDGESLVAVCTGEQPAYDRRLCWRTIARAAARDGRWKYLADRDGEYLFDLLVDPGEKDDRRGAEPARFDRLKQQYRLERAHAAAPRVRPARVIHERCAFVHNAPAAGRPFLAAAGFDTALRAVLETPPGRVLSRRPGIGA